MSSIPKDCSVARTCNTGPQYVFNHELLKWVKLDKNKPPQEWFDSNDDPFAPEDSR